MSLNVNSSYEDIRKYFDDIYRPKKDEALAKNDEVYRKQGDTVKEYYNNQKKETELQYDDLFKENEMQEYVDRAELQEDMANLGLTNSGLNLTQTTALKASANNNAARIKRKMQSSIDYLNREMAAKLSDIENQRSQRAQAIGQQFDSSVDDLAGKQYKINTDYLEDLEKSRIASNERIERAKISSQQRAERDSAKQAERDAYIIRTSGGLLNRDYKGRLEDNDVDVIYGDKDITYIDNRSGKKTTLKRGINPYTGTVNKDVKDGTFRNGYQPNNIKGVKLDRVKGNKVDPQIEVNGNPQAIWRAGNKYYYWSGMENKYNELTNAEVKELGIIGG